LSIGETWEYGHVSGLAYNPGTVTVPLIYVYVLLKMASSGNEDARDFFASSREMGKKSKGAPEVLVIFTSAEVIEPGVSVTVS